VIAAERRWHTPALGVGVALLLAASALLSSCGGSGKGLIPIGDAGPLQSDFQAVARAAEEGDGSCAATEAAIETTERDFNSLPLVVDAGLRRRLREGIANLRARSLALCAQPLPQVTTATSTPTETATQTAPTQTPTTTTQTGTTSPPETPGPGGGTEVPPEESQPPAGGEAEGSGEQPGAGGGGK